MSVVTICLGESGTENYTGIVKFMDVLLSSSRAATEKKKILEEEFGVAMNEELEREVLVMCNLSQGVKAEGREEGINIGEMRMLVWQMMTCIWRACLLCEQLTIRSWQYSATLII